MAADAGGLNAVGDGSVPQGDAGVSGDAGPCVAPAWWSRDVDGDGFGDPDQQVQGCSRPDGFVDNALDCDDTSPLRRPGHPELCDGVDNDCDTQTSDECPVSWTSGTLNGRAYQFSAGPLSWSAASLACREQGLRLVRLESARESEWVHARVREELGINVWIGATDLDREGVWRWEDGEVFWRGDGAGSAEGGAYTRWAADEPNGGRSENCAELRGGSLWNDAVCTDRQGFVCESP